VKINGRNRGTPTGTVTFIEGSTVLGSAAVRDGKARFTTKALPIGQDAIQAVYNGSKELTPSRSAVRLEVIRAGRSRHV
jgi:Bacterial Ig-like domain (group 3)